MWTGTTGSKRQIVRALSCRLPGRDTRTSIPAPASSTPVPASPAPSASPASTGVVRRQPASASVVRRQPASYPASVGINRHHTRPLPLRRQLYLSAPRASRRKAFTCDINHHHTTLQNNMLFCHDDKIRQALRHAKLRAPASSRRSNPRAPLLVSPQAS